MTRASCSFLFARQRAAAWPQNRFRAIEPAADVLGQADDVVGDEVHPPVAVRREPRGVAEDLEVPLRDGAARLLPCRLLPSG